MYAASPLSHLSLLRMHMCICSRYPLILCLSSSASSICARMYTSMSHSVHVYVYMHVRIDYLLPT